MIDLSYDQDKCSPINNVGCQWEKGRRENSVFHLYRCAVDCVGVCAVGESGGHFHLVSGVGEIDDGRAGIAAGHHGHCAVVGGCNGFLLSGHGVTETVGSDYFGMEKLVVAPRSHDSVHVCVRQDG